MENIELFIDESEQLTGIFGYWPSFHDAEVIELSLWRGDIRESEGRFIFPQVTAKLHVWELTHQADSRGVLQRRHHTLVTLQFHDVGEFTMQDFNHQNAIFALKIERGERSEGPSPHFYVCFESAFGMGASFQCRRIAVLNAARCSENGIVMD